LILCRLMPALKCRPIKCPSFSAASEARCYSEMAALTLWLGGMP
jgi:hypothetical protein